MKFRVKVTHYSDREVLLTLKFPAFTPNDKQLFIWNVFHPKFATKYKHIGWIYEPFVETTIDKAESEACRMLDRANTVSEKYDELEAKKKADKKRRRKSEKKSRYLTEKDCK